MRVITLLVAITALAVAAPAIADKGGNGSPRPASYSPTLSVSWPLGATTTSGSTSTPYVVNGCGYDSSYGSVTVVVYTPVAAAWSGQLPDAGGCISVSNFSTQGPGSYKIQAWQHTGKRDVMVASTGFTL